VGAIRPAGTNEKRTKEIYTEIPLVLKIILFFRRLIGERGVIIEELAAGINS
jgi:hypothetical protein